jgi:hypothetical protein
MKRIYSETLDFNPFFRRQERLDKWKSQAKTQRKREEEEKGFFFFSLRLSGFA